MIVFLGTETCSILSQTTRTISVIVHGGYILCLTDNVKTKRGEPHEKNISVVFKDRSDGTSGSTSTSRATASKSISAQGSLLDNAK